MGKLIERTFSPEESKKMFGNRSLIIVRGGTGRRSEQHSKNLLEVTKLLEEEVREVLQDQSISVVKGD